MAEQVNTEPVINIAFALTGDVAKAFLRWKENQSLTVNAEAARCALFKQMKADGELRPVAAETTPRQARRVEQ